MSNLGGKSAVDSIIAEAMDAIALDHITKLNTAHLSSTLPSDLESRFKKLKSFPSSTTTNPSTTSRSNSLPVGKENNAPASPPPPPPPPPQPPVPPAVSPVEIEVREKPPIRIETPPLQTRSPHKPSLSDSNFDESEFSTSRRRDPPSLVERLVCCFPFSPKKITTPKSKGKDRNSKEGNCELDSNRVDEWDDMNKQMIREIKDHQRKLSKALKEQAKMSREAAKMVKLVKHASARMTHDINDDLFSDGDDDELAGTGTGTRHFPDI